MWWVVCSKSGVAPLPTGLREWRGCDGLVVYEQDGAHGAWVRDEGHALTNVLLFHSSRCCQVQKRSRTLSPRRQG